jgi:gliding motility-associated-like protein
MSLLLSFIQIGHEGYAQCNLQINLILSACNNNGTPCNNDDDQYLVTIVVDNPGVPSPGYSATFGPISTGLLPYGPDPVIIGVVDADRSGPVICLDVVDESDPTCTGQVCSDPLFPCDIQPILPSITLECDDNRTANDDTDDTYVIEFLVGLAEPFWRGQFEVNAQGSTFGPFPYGQVNSIRLDADGTTQIFEVQDNLDPECLTFERVGPLEPCSEPCAQTPQIISTECNDNGTPNPNDDYYIIRVISSAVTQGSSGRYGVFTPLVGQLYFPYGSIGTLAIPARGQTQPVIFSDFDYDDCNEELEIGPLDPCSEFCDVDVDTLFTICDDNGTPDPSDDFHEVFIRVSGMNAGSGYTIQIMGDRYGPFDYDSIETFIVPADGSTLRLNIRDVDFTSDCSTFEFIGPLEPCSFPCDLTIDDLEWQCDDNGTSDPSDDFYTITASVSSPLVGPADSILVETPGNLFGPFEYGIGFSFTLPADGTQPILIFRDLVLGSRCELDSMIGSLIPCSSDCEIDVQVSNVNCDNAGTGFDNADDVFFFDVVLTGQNIGPSWQADDPAMTVTNYGQNVTFGPYLISAGPVTIRTVDTQDDFCRSSFTVDPPAPCSDSCALTLLSREEGPCNDNNTGPDRTDDFYFIELEVGATNQGPSGQYEVRLQGTLIGTYNYNTPEIVGPLPADGTILTLVIRDVDLVYCELILTTTQEPCSDCDVFTVDAGDDKLITCSENEVTLEGSASAQGSYEWTGPGGRQYSGRNPSVGEPGTYILTVTFDKECTATDSVVVRRDQALPFADPGVGGDITCKVESIEIGGDSTSLGTQLVYQWTDAQGMIISNTRKFTVTMPGRYCLQVIDTLLDCESAINCVTIGENKVPPSGRILVNPEDAFDCRIDSISLTADNGSNTDFFWEKGNLTFFRDTLWVTDTGRVFLILEDTINGCTSKLDVTLNSLVDFPVISIARPDEITCLQEEVTIDGTASQSGPTIFYQWYASNGVPIPGATNRSLRVDQPGFYFFESLDTLTGCINIDTVEVDENRIFHDANAGEDALIKCDSISIILDASQSTQRNNISYSWRRILGDGNVIQGNGTLFPEIDGQGVFELQVVDDFTGCVSRDTVIVDKAFAPALDRIIVENERCGGDELGLIDVVGIRGISPFTYELNGRSVDTTRFDSLAPGLFFFRVTDSLGCFTDTLLKVKEGNFFDFRIQGDTFIIKGDSTELKVDINIPPSQIDQIYWEEDGSVFCFRCTSIVVKPDTTTTYTFRLFDVNGCDYEFDFVVKVQDENDIFVPNIFTPNEDTENEILHVFGKNLVNIEKMLIFNRWGELVFQGFDIPPGPVWDGRWNGDYHVPAVLSWLIIAEFEDGEVKQFTGDVTLLR